MTSDGLENSIFSYSISRNCPEPIGKVFLNNLDNIHLVYIINILLILKDEDDCHSNIYIL